MASPAASLDADAVAAYLLDRRHLLSAFELYQDLISPGGAASTKAGERDVVRDGDADARAKLEAFFGDQKRFALSDVRAHAGAVDGAPRDTPVPRITARLLPPGRRDATGSNTRPRSNTLPPTVPTLRATVREQESRIKLAEYERRCAEEDLARLREERETRAVPATPRRSQNADGDTAVVFEQIRSPAATTRTPRRTPRATASSTAPSASTWRTWCRSRRTRHPDDGTPTAPPAVLPDITPGERRCLNLVTHQYLARRGCRAAALAMRQEATAGQDLDDWSPLGGEPARAEALRLMLRRAKALETLDPAAFEKMRERDDPFASSATSKRPKKRSNPNWRRRRATWTRSAASWPRARAEYEAAATESERWRAKFDEAAATVRHVERAAQRARREAGESPGGDSPGGSMAPTTKGKGSSALESAARRRPRFSAAGIAAESVAPTLSFSTERSCCPCTLGRRRGRGCVQNAPPRSRRCCRA